MKKEIKSFVGENIKRLRGNKTLDTVAYETGISKAYLSQLENGQSKRPSIQIALKLADYFEVDYRLFCFNPLPPRDKLKKQIWK